MPFTGVNDGQSGPAPSLKQTAIGIDGAAKLRDVIAEHFSKPAWLEKVSLHVDDQQGTAHRINFVGIRFSLDAQSGSVDHGRAGLGCGVSVVCKRLACQDSDALSGTDEWASGERREFRAGTGVGEKSRHLSSVQ